MKSIFIQINNNNYKFNSFIIFQSLNLANNQLSCLDGAMFNFMLNLENLSMANNDFDPSCSFNFIAISAISKLKVTVNLLMQF